MWKREVENVGQEKASMMRVLWRFARTRIFVSAIVQIFTLTLAFIAHVSTMSLTLFSSQRLLI